MSYINVTFCNNNFYSNIDKFQKNILQFKMLWKV